MSWKILLSGYLPDYLYELGRIDTAKPFADLEKLSRVNERAQGRQRRRLLLATPQARAAEAGAAAVVRESVCIKIQPRTTCRIACIMVSASGTIARESRLAGEGWRC
jgi:hypothetical protein